MSKLTKSVFLYGHPTKIKRNILIEMQQEYTNLINYFIDTMINNNAYYLYIFNNNKKAPIIRELEKTHRTKLGSALGQNAIDTAVKELSNHFTRIKNTLYGEFKENKKLFVSSIFMLNSMILKIPLKDALTQLKGLIKIEEDKLKDKTKSNSKIDFYKELQNILNKMSDKEFDLISSEIRDSFEEELFSNKVPFVKNIPLQLDTRLCTIEKAENVKADFVISIKTLDRGKRIEIPIKTSKNSLRRLNQYENCSPTISVKGHKIRIGIPFEKKLQDNNITNTIGIDVGVTDLMHLSTGEAIGSFTNMLKLYDATVLVKEKNRSNLRNYMRELRKMLKKSKNNKEKEILREKICHINTMLQGRKTANRIRRKYNHEVSCMISLSVNKLISLISKNTQVAIEDIDLIIGDTNKRFNRKISNWARGQLLKKIEEKLQWKSIKVERVEPAYTSQLCPKCFNIDENNRNGKTFKCTCCGHTDDADNNASNNIAQRVNDKEIKEVVDKYSFNTKLRHKKIKELYLNRHNTATA